MKLLDYIFYCAYSYFRTLNDDIKLPNSILYVYMICYTILYPIVTSLEWLCLGHCNLKTWQIILIESPLIIYLIYRYIKYKKEILDKFAHCHYSKKKSFIFIILLLFVLLILANVIAYNLQSRILKRGLEGTWNIPEFFSNFAGVWDC